MSHDELENLASLYALGALDGEDLSRFMAHLAECDRCRRLVREHEEASAALAFALPPVHPAPAVKERILARVRAKAFPWSRLAAAAVLVIAAIAAYLWIVRPESETERFTRLVREPGSQVVELKGTDDAPGAQAWVVWTAREFAILGRAMPRLPEGRVFELWALAGGKAIPARIYRMDARGNLVPGSEAAAPPSKVDAFAVTIEKGLASAPTPPIRMKSN